MHIYLTDTDISEMPESLRQIFLEWLPLHLETQTSSVSQLVTESCVFNDSLKVSDILGSPIEVEKPENSHVKLSQLLDAGITKKGMAVRVKLKRVIAARLGRDYINSLELSSAGTIFHQGEEFEKPSPLAAKLNDGAVNGWEYVEVKKDNKWIRLEELRQIWRSTND